MHPVEYAIISAAGMGSRLELNMPKCLVEIAGRCIIDHMLDLLQEIPNVRMVVGFMEDQVIDHVRRIRDDVVFVRNPHFQTTSNCYSLHLASRYLDKPFFALDGDLLITPDSFQNFLNACDGTESIIGITASKTEEAVFVELDDTQTHVVNFRRHPITPFEWCGIACLHKIPVRKTAGFLFEEIEKHLPLRAHNITCFEVDTPEDLSYAMAHFKP